MKKSVKAYLLVSDAANLAYDNNFFDAIIDNKSINYNTIRDIKDILEVVGFRELNIDFIKYSDRQVKMEEYVVSAIKK